MAVQSTRLPLPAVKKYVVIFLVAGYLAINLFRIGQDYFIQQLNNLVVLPLAMGLSLLALFLWQRVAVGKRAKWLWLGLTVGWMLWTVAEWWWAIAALIQEEVPYPSPADIFWLVGYIFLFWGLGIRIRLMPKIAYPEQKLILWLVSIFFSVAALIFVFIPIWQSNEPGAFVENTLNILYPLMDLVLLILSVRLFFAYRQGVYGGGWLWFLVGFVFLSVADLLFAYASTVDLYYPEQQLNFLSTLGVDVPYNLAYLFWIIGALKLGMFQQSARNVGVSDVIDEIESATFNFVPNTHILVFTRQDDAVVEVSHNYPCVFQEESVRGRYVGHVLGIADNEMEKLLEDIKRFKVVAERPYFAMTRFGKQQVGISGMADTNPAGEYFGAMILVRLYCSDYSFDTRLSTYQREMIRSVLKKTGTERKRDDEAKTLLARYYSILLRAIYQRVLIEGGSILADALLSDLQVTIRQKSWAMVLNSDFVLNVQGMSYAEAVQALRELYDFSVLYGARAVNEASIQALLETVNDKFDPTVLENITYAQQFSAT
ncbi:MAG: hypothetical protein D6706_12025 [Chloroflexi bacterium]|nr:MAG: hypothetical protein D6706_12025 [Chloroflexota bacterium]